MDEPPDGEGTIRHASFVIRGVCFGGLLWKKIAAEFFFLELKPPMSGASGRRHSLKVNGVLRTNAEVVILDRDINDALRAFPRPAGRLSVNFFPGSVRCWGCSERTGRIRV